MKLTINLPLLKLNATFSEETIRYGKDSRIELWRSKKLKKLPESIKFAQDIFFQDNLEMDETFFNSIELNSLDVTFELVRMMFDNLQKVMALQQYMEVRFDEIYPLQEPDKAYHLYEINGTEYMVFYNKELMDLAVEFELNTLQSASMSDIMGQIEYVEDYFEVINVKKAAQKIRDNVDKLGISENDLPNNIYNDDKKLMQWMAEENEEFMSNILEETFDFLKFAQQSIENLDDAVNKLNDYIGGLVSTEDIICDGYPLASITIFEKN